MRYRTVQIDIDVHKAIEAARLGFTDSDNDVLRRLLGLPPAEASADAIPHPIETSVEVEPGAWSRDGAVLPNGTLLRMTYNGQMLHGQVANGVWIVNGQMFTSPSGAAMKNVRTKSGNTTSLDGWTYWWVKRPQDPDYIQLSTLRKKAA